MNKEYSHSNEDEIDLIKLFRLVLHGRKNIVKFVVVFAIGGLFTAIFSEKEYRSQTVVMPQISNSKAGRLSGLAAITGINIGGGDSGGISPILYPKIVSSIPFRRALLKTKLNIKGVPEKVTYREYYQEYYKPSLLSVVKKYTVGLPGVVLGLFRNKGGGTKTTYSQDSICKVSVFEDLLFKKINNQLEISVLEKEGVVNISYVMPEPLASAQMTKASQELLQNAIIDFKIKKIKGEVDFIQNRHDEVKKDFIKKQSRLAAFKDQNRDFTMSRSQTRLQRLKGEYNLSYELYSELAKRLETQKIKLKENTPVFSTIDPVSIPIKNFRPKKVMILVIWVFLGFVLGVLVVLTRDFLKKIKKIENEL